MASTATATHYDWVPTGPDDATSSGPALESQSFRDDLYDFTNDFFAYLRRQPDLPEWYRTPVDLFEAARIELMMQLRPPIRDWIAWRRLIGLKSECVELAAPDVRIPTLAADLGGMNLPFEIRLRSFKTGTKPRERKPSAFRLAAHRLINHVESRWLPRVQVPLGDAARTRVLLLDQHANSTQILIPVWKQLSASPQHQCLYVAGREKIRRALARHGITAPNLRRCGPYVAESKLRPPQWSQFVQRYFADLAERYGVPSPPSVLRSFESAAEYLSEVKLTAIRLEQVFHRFRPEQFFVSSGAHMPARVGELLCRDHDCLSVHIQHGVYKGDKESRDLLADVICLWGEFHRRRMELNPCPSELLITGSPKHDELRQKYAALSQSQRPLVVFYSTRSGSWVIGVRDFERHLAAVYAAAKALPDVEFVVKLHPGETRATVERLSTNSSRPPNVRVTQADDAYELLQRCHAAMTVSSTVGYEALLFRRPLLILNLTGQECQLPMPRECMADYVTQAEDLASAVRRVLASPTSSVAAADDFWLNDGNALERILTSADCRSRRTTMERQP